MKTDTRAHAFQAEKARLTAALERLRAEARCANELERGHLLYRLGQQLGVHKEAVLELGFDAAYRRIVGES